MRKQYDILVLSDPASKAKQKWPQRPSKRTKYQARRLNNPLITFYDLGQVNNNASLDDEPVWSDHPILKTPSYTQGITTSHGFDDVLLSVDLTVDPFDNADYQTLTDLMFTYPVDQWNRRYRKVEESTGIDTDFDTNLLISLRDASSDAPGGQWLPDNEISRSGNGASYDATKTANLANNNWTWDRDRHGAIKKNLTELTVNAGVPILATPHYAGYLSMSTTNKDIYKVTATYDPNAADVGTLTPQGNIEVYMMPQVGLFAATSQTDLFANGGSAFDYKTTQILGPVYQIQPRHLWPRYVTDPEITGTGGDYGDDTAVSNYIDYQQNRSGMQASTWTWTGTTPTDHSYTFDDALLPEDWSTLDQYGLAMASGNNTTSNDFFSSAARGGNTATNFPRFSTVFKPTASGFWGGFMFRGDEPFLVAVFKMSGRFYYVWDIYAAANSFNWSSSETYNQGVRYRLTRGVSWNPSFIDSVPPTPKDGTGSNFSL